MAEGADPAEARKSLSKRNSSGLQDNPFLRSDSQKAPSGAALESEEDAGAVDGDERRREVRGVPAPRGEGGGPRADRRRGGGGARRHRRVGGGERPELAERRRGLALEEDGAGDPGGSGRDVPRGRRAIPSRGRRRLPRKSAPFERTRGRRVRTPPAPRSRLSARLFLHAPSSPLPNTSPGILRGPGTFLLPRGPGMFLLPRGPGAPFPPLGRRVVRPGVRPAPRRRRVARPAPHLPRGGEPPLERVGGRGPRPEAPPDLRGVGGRGRERPAPAAARDQRAARVKRRPPARRSPDAPLRPPPSLRPERLALQ